MINLNDSNFFYQSLTEEIGAEVLSALSRGIKNYEGCSIWPYPFQIDSEENVVQWKYDVKRFTEATQPSWDIYATAGPDATFEPSIELNIFLNKGKWIKGHGIDRAVLYGVIAHEIHHIAQGPELDDIAYSENQVDYFLDPREREAFHIGFRAQSFYSSVPMIECMKDYLLPRFSLGILTKGNIEDILEAWLNIDWAQD